MIVGNPRDLYPLFTVRHSSPALGPGVFKILDDNLQRIGILFGVASTGTAFWGVDTALSTSKYLFQTGSTVTMQLDFQRFGALVQGPWYAIGTGTLGTVEVVEVLYDPTRLA